VLLTRRALAEALGTALLLTAVVGSGIAAQRLSPGEPGLQLLENAAATAVALVAIILAVGPVSGAHLNPLVTLVDRAFGGVSNREAAVYCGAQITGALVGTGLANLMFDLPVLEVSDQARSGGGLWLGEAIATFGLILTILGTVRHRREWVPASVALYITAAYWFTSSTSFANPAITVARSLSDSFAGIAPQNVPAFVAAQLVGAGLGALLARLHNSDHGRAAQRREAVIPSAPPDRLKTRRNAPGPPRGRSGMTSGSFACPCSCRGEDPTWSPESGMGRRNP
jgi:arsenate reductase